MKTAAFLFLVFLSTNLMGQSVYIPDTSFKAILVGNSAINTNGDTEIQMSEASSYDGGIECFGSNISDLTGIEAFTALTGLFCTSNNLTSLDVSQNVNLVLLHCGFNSIASLDISDLSALTILYAPGNLITNLNTDGAEALIHLDCSHNLITTLDLSQNTNLDHIDCQFNHLQCLNVANGNNTNVVEFWATGNPNLSCVEVDDIVYADYHWQPVFQPIGSQFEYAFSVNCYEECSDCPPASSTDTQTACGSYTWIDGNTYTSSNNTATFNIAGGTVNGCDSIVTLDLTISHSSTSSISETSCDTYTAPDGEVYTDSGIYSVTVSNALGCDSIIAIELTIYPTPNNDVIQNDYTLIAAETGAEYQWVDCDNENININGETNQSFTASSSGNYAVIVTANECSNMSDCILMNFTGTGNLSNTPKTLIKILDLMGRETNFKPNIPLIYVYDDGSIEKVFSVEY